MNGKQIVKQLAVASVLAACVVGGTRLWGQAATAPAVAPPQAGPGVVPPAPAPDWIATISGKEVDPQFFNDVLMEVAGMRVFQDVFDYTVVRDAFRNAGKSLTDDEFKKLVEAERELTIAGVGGPGLTDAERLKVLDKLLHDKGVTGSEFSMVMQRQALLRLMSKGNVKDPEEKEVQDAFVAQYGPKVKIVVLTVKSIKDAEAVRDALGKGGDIRTIAGSKSIPWQEVTIPSNNADPAPVSTFKDLAFGTDKIKGLNVKELSATIPFTPQGGTEVLYMVYLDEKIAKQDVLLPAVRTQVEKDVRNMKETSWMNGQLNFLRANATFEFQNKVLKLQQKVMQEMIDKQKAANAAAGAGSPATAPATAPAAPPATAPAPK